MTYHWICFRKKCSPIFCLSWLSDVLSTKIVLVSYHNSVFIRLRRDHYTKLIAITSFDQKMALACKTMLIFVISSGNNHRMLTSTSSGFIRMNFLLLNSYSNPIVPTPVFLPPPPLPRRKTGVSTFLGTVSIVINEKK